MPTHSTAPIRILGVLLLCVTLTTACTSEPPPGNGSPPSPSASDAVPLTEQTTSTASDGGHVEFAESAVTAFEDEHGRDAYTWAVGVTNTSATDLLVYALYDRALIDRDGVTHSYPETAVYTVLPGQTMYQGDVTSTDFVPTGIAPVLTSATWVRMAALAEQGVDAGLELTDGALQRDGDTFVARVSFTSRGIGVAEQLVDVLVVFRDTAGKLLGALVAGETKTFAAGPHDAEASFARDRWLPEADPATSVATINVSCCEAV